MAERLTKKQKDLLTLIPKPEEAKVKVQVLENKIYVDGKYSYVVGENGEVLSVVHVEKSGANESGYCS